MLVHGKNQFSISVKNVPADRKVELRTSITNFKNGIALGYFNRCVWYNTVPFDDNIPQISTFFTKHSFKEMNFIALTQNKDKFDPFDQLINQKLEEVHILSYFDQQTEKLITLTDDWRQEIPQTSNK